MESKIRIIYIDYARIYYKEHKKRFPKNYTGKFVQMRNNSKEYLVFSPREFTRYHADIIERFCMDREIPGMYDKKNKCFDIIDLAWSVIGGGKFEIDKKKKYLKLYDNSMVYGRYDRRGIKEKILSIEEFSDYEVDVE
jgi:hypothetical protein